MRLGGGQGKGASFEREVAVKLSLWVSGGRSKDLFWRTAMSGGRATVHKAKGSKIRQSGDICSVSPEGHPLTDTYYIECKHLKNISLGEFIFKHTGPLTHIWYTANKEAAEYGKKPLVIIRQNLFPTLVISPIGVQTVPMVVVPRRFEIDLFDIFLEGSPHKLIPQLPP